jgi:predicted protein tyrosine phosphatase
LDGRFEVHVSALRQGRLIADAERLHPTHLLSLLNPDHDEPGLSRIAPLAKRHLVRFHDSLVAGKPGGFTRDHLREILAFVEPAIESSRTAPVRLLVHCHHGQSRSPAVAYLALALAFGPGRESEAFEQVRRNTADIWPNSIIIETADAALGREGALVRPLAAFQAKYSPPSAGRIL